MTEKHDGRIDLLVRSIRDVADFPKPGIGFKDITPLLADPRAFTTCIDLLAEHCAGKRVDTILAIESRGFIFGAALAARLTASFVPARKPGKLPSATDRVTYVLEYGEDSVEIHKDAIKPGTRVMVVDDVIATGGTAWAAMELVRRQRGEVIGAAFVIELGALDGRKRIAPVEPFALIRY
jgi:adenine phosphoribosyltransferase